MGLKYTNPDILNFIETLKTAKNGDPNPLHHYQKLNNLGYLLEYLLSKVDARSHNPAVVTDKDIRGLAVVYEYFNTHPGSKMVIYADHSMEFWHDPSGENIMLYDTLEDLS